MTDGPVHTKTTGENERRRRGKGDSQNQNNHTPDERTTARVHPPGSRFPIPPQPLPLFSRVRVCVLQPPVRALRCDTTRAQVGGDEVRGEGRGVALAAALLAIHRRTLTGVQLDTASASARRAHRWCARHPIGEHKTQDTHRHAISDWLSTPNCEELPCALLEPTRDPSNQARGRTGS